MFTVDNLQKGICSSQNICANIVLNAYKGITEKKFLIETSRDIIYRKIINLTMFF